MRDRTGRSARITIRDVAERAGCGVATVSRVLNASGPASVETRERVFAAARTLGFEFSDLGRSLQRRCSRMLGIVVPTLGNPVFAEAIEGAQRAATLAGYQVLLACANYDADVEADAVRTFLAKQADGVVLVVSDPDDSAALEHLEKAGVPFCLMFNQPAGDTPTVGVDNVAAARAVGEMLVRAGHERTAFLALRFRSSERARRRYEGLVEALGAHGLPTPPLLEVHHAPECLKRDLAALLAAEPHVTALFASNDILALAAIRALRALGRRVPQDLAVVGFDGIAVSELVEPSLATVETPNGEMGRVAAEAVMRAIAEDRPVPPGSVHLPFSFRSGGSLGVRGPKPPAAASDARDRPPKTALRF